MIYLFLTISTITAFILWLIVKASRAQVRGLEKSIWSNNKTIFTLESKILTQKSELANLADKLATFSNLYNDVQHKYEDLLLKESAIREKKRIQKAAQRAKKKEVNK
jgi:hypothetical protein